MIISNTEEIPKGHEITFSTDDDEPIMTLNISNELIHELEKIRQYHSENQNWRKEINKKELKDGSG